jgi:hypothetical protein
VLLFCHIISKPHDFSLSFFSHVVPLVDLSLPLITSPRCSLSSFLSRYRCLFHYKPAHYSCTRTYTRRPQPEISIALPLPPCSCSRTVRSNLPCIFSHPACYSSAFFFHTKISKPNENQHLCTCISALSLFSVYRRRRLLYINAHRLYLSVCQCHHHLYHCLLCRFRRFLSREALCAPSLPKHKGTPSFLLSRRPRICCRFALTTHIKHKRSSLFLALSSYLLPLLPLFDIFTYSSPASCPPFPPTFCLFF